MGAELGLKQEWVQAQELPGLEEGLEDAEVVRETWQMPLIGAEDRCRPLCVGPVNHLMGGIVGSVPPTPASGDLASLSASPPQSCRFKLVIHSPHRPWESSGVMLMKHTFSLHSLRPTEPEPAFQEDPPVTRGH